MAVRPPARSLFSRDLRWLRRHAAAIGIITAIVCHFLPERYKGACHMITALCGGH